jgi:uncharacterized protein (DUF2141 family)
MYLLEIQLTKTVDGWNNEKGAKGAQRFSDHWNTTTKVSDLPTKETIQRLLESSDRCLTFSEFNLFDPGHYVLAVLENDNGDRDDNGKWLADYDIYIGVYKLDWVKDFSPV